MKNGKSRRKERRKPSFRLGKKKKECRIYSQTSKPEWSTLSSTPKRTKRSGAKLSPTPKQSKTKLSPTPKRTRSEATLSSTAKRKTRHSSKRSVPNDEGGVFSIQESAADPIPEDFDNYLNSLEIILAQPVSETQDPSLSAEQLVKLKLIEEISSFSEVFLESRELIEQVDEFFATLEGKKAKVTSLKNEYNELKEKADQLQSQVDSSLLTVQEIDIQIALLQSRRDELTNAIETNKAAKSR
ncbi:hypothetical protein GH714_019920 [Hevea brasiliensis]|uniref:Uncharacterized protein n=1 Tax=Hevea brasiliensis TaxID=3981 RepID=A0A6A6K7M7_HEVBR|nr:hypothetical protein GH714_019920 [Hevea brasiliensis]